MNPRNLYRIVSIAEAVTWTLLIVGMVLKYVTHTTELGVRVGGALHGFAFLCFVVVTLLTAANARWSARPTLLGLASAVVPWATLVFDRWAEAQGMLPSTWRLARGGEQPAGVLDGALAWVLRHPLAAFLLALIGISVVFSALLWLGPPTKWGPAA